MKIKMENVLKVGDKDIDINEIVSIDLIKNNSIFFKENFKDISVSYIGAFIDDYGDCKMKFDVAYKNKIDFLEQDFRLITTLKDEKLTAFLSNIKDIMPRESEIKGIKPSLIYRHFNGRGNEKLGEFFINIFSKENATKIEAQSPKVSQKAKMKAKTKKKSNDLGMGI